MDKRKLSREQLDASLLRFNPLLNTTLPSRGWIKALRYAIGMSARQLADRLGVTQQRVDRIEKEELTGSLTIKTMQRVANSLDCVFVYGFVPRTNLEEIVRNRAREVAINRLNRVTHTMSLEHQAITKKENQGILNHMVEKLVNQLPPNLWDEK